MLSYGDKLRLFWNGDTQLEEDKDLSEFKTKMAMEYQESYSWTIILLFVLVLVKRILTDDSMSPKDLALLLGSLTVFIVFSRSYRINDYTRRYTPYLLAFFSYFAHSMFIFKRSFEEPGDPS